MLFLVLNVVFEFHVFSVELGHSYMRGKKNHYFCYCAVKITLNGLMVLSVKLLFGFASVSLPFHVFGSFVYSYHYSLAF